MTETLLDSLVERIMSPEPPAFALVRRSEGHGPARVEVFVGEVTHPASLVELPLPVSASNVRCAAQQDVLVVIPYRQLRERGFACREDGAPLIALSITEQGSLSEDDAMRRIADDLVELEDGGFDIEDEAYAELVRRVIADEIGTGAGSNFVIKRNYVGRIEKFSPRKALTVFRRLLQSELGAYWTFVVHTRERTLVGATPERHLKLSSGKAVMNPISGTYRYPASGPTLDGMVAFLADRKESDELYMVLDEELKMMSRICETGGTVTGPHVREMTCLAHTEYSIEGTTKLDVPELLRETLFAPTVTGSPLESATRVIQRYERVGRGYYSGVIGLIGRDAQSQPTLDSAILIRTADIDRTGNVRIGVGATLVRHSRPASEVLETRAKVAALLAALRPRKAARLSEHPHVQEALRQRNARIATFWLRPPSERHPRVPEFSSVRALILDAEDNFTAMLAHQLRALGLTPDTRRITDTYQLEQYDVVVLGPGPGDPRDLSDPRIARLRRVLDSLLETGQPFLAVCLSHQVLSARLGLELMRRDVPAQGLQVAIDLFGNAESVGFYNTFVATAYADELEITGVGTVRVSRDPSSGIVHALHGSSFGSMQFHPESVLTVDGPRILCQSLKRLLAA